MKTTKKDDFDISFDIPEASFDVDMTPAVKIKTPGAALGIGKQRCVTKARRRSTYDLSRVPGAVELLARLPDPEETIHAIMGGDFHAWDLIPAAHQMLGGPIAELVVTTLGFNLANNQNLCDMLDAGAIGRAFLLCSTYFEAADKDVYNTAKERLESRGQKIAAVRNHSKIILIAPASRKDRYVFESSANLRSCNNLEQMTLTNSPELFAFHRGWILPLIK